MKDSKPLLKRHEREKKIGAAGKVPAEQPGQHVRTLEGEARPPTFGELESAAITWMAARY